MASHEEVLALHRYFLQASQMRAYYDQRLANEGAASVQDERWPEQWIDLCLWYACLYIVVEGWRALALADAKVDALLTSTYVDLLRRFRNGVDHYQATYWDDRFTDFVAGGAESAVWVRSLHSAFGRWFQDWFDARRASTERRASRP